MLRSDLRNLASQFLDDPNNGYFTVAVLNIFLNNAQREVQKQLIQAGEMYYLKIVETTTVANQQDYVLPSDFIKSHRLEIVLSGTGVNEDKQTIAPITLNQQSLVANLTGTPTGYVMKKNKISLFPIPTQALTLRLYYSSRVADMSTDNDLPDVPEDYHEYIAILAAIDGKIKDDGIPANLQYKKEYYEKLMKQSMDNRQSDQPRMIVETSQEGFFGVF